jgi:hypothetical protein
MRDRCSVFAVALLLGLPAAALAQETKTYPALEGMWDRGSPIAGWDPDRPPGKGQQAPLTAEYQAIYEANISPTRTAI